MNRTRVIPVLLLSGRGLVKTVKFKQPKYLGDPINAVRIFNEKEADELVFLDITATPEGRGPNFDLLSDIASEAFMPMAYGGGLTTLDQVKRVFDIGFEKVILNSVAYKKPRLISDAAAIFGSQSIVGCVDVRKNFLGRYELCSVSAKVREKSSLFEHLDLLIQSGVGEILVNAVDRDGTMAGYDLKLLREVTAAVTVPVVACGGAGSVDHLVEALQDGNASALAAGSLFVFMGPHRAVMINYPDRKLLTDRLA